MIFYLYFIFETTQKRKLMAEKENENEESKAGTRTVLMDAKAVQRVEKYIAKMRAEKGIRLTIGNVFAMALDKMLNENEGV